MLNCKLIGESNEGIVVVQNEQFKALIDSGSMVTTLSISGYNCLQNKPELKELSNLGLEVTVADGSLLDYRGYIECTLQVPCMNLEVFVPVLIVQDTEFNKNCPVIIGTNVLRICREFLGDSTYTYGMPNAWKIALDSMRCQTYSVKSICKKTLIVEPNESVVIKRRTKGVPTKDDLTLVTESSDHDVKFIVCPRVVKLSAHTTKPTVQVKICNISAKPISIKHGTVLCDLKEVKAVNNDAELHHTPRKK